MTGEVPVDRLPDNRRTLGALTLNVVWNLQGLGVTPLLISDELEKSKPLLPTAIRATIAFAARVCSLRVATREDLDFYNLRDGNHWLDRFRPTGAIHQIIEHIRQS